jgi:hypothetical protein
MLKRMLLCAPLLALSLASPASGEGSEPAAIDRTFAFAATEIEQAARRPDAALLSQLAGWLSANFGLAAMTETPRIEFVTPARMAAVRFRGVASDRQAAEAGRSAPPEFGHDIYALYDSRSRTIYLHERWDAGSPADMSILAHELVHHLQNLSGEQFACPHGREKDAYAAQRAWLAQSGRTIEEEFEIDAMTILVRSNCLD